MEKHQALIATHNCINARFNLLKQCMVVLDALLRYTQVENTINEE
jgi:hypothetical protein